MTWKVGIELKSQETNLNLVDFLSKNGIELSDQAYQICRDGIEMMRSSQDPHHSEKHVFGILDDLELFLNNEKSVNTAEINFNVLLPAICWHDVWKSTRVQTTNIFILMYEQYHDGKGSAKLFQDKYEDKIAEILFKEIKYAIKVHQRLDFIQKLDIYKKRFFPIKTLEAKILKDVDRLNEWSIQRLENLEAAYLDEVKDNPALVRVAEFWLRRVVLNYSQDVFYFNWSKQEFGMRKKIILKRINELLENKDKYLN